MQKSILGNTIHPFWSLCLLFVYFITSLVIFNIIALFVIALIYKLDFNSILNIYASGNITKLGRSALLIYQLISTPIGGFIIPVIFWNNFNENQAFNSLFGSVKSTNYIQLGLTFVLVLAFMPINSLIIEWNSSLVLPEFLKGIENWARIQEDNAEYITKYLTDFSGLAELLLGIIVIAIVTGFAEELFFRGAFQQKIFHIAGNAHAAIWITGFIFSFVHFQFFGFVPRMLLGVAFGYLFYWTGSLWVAMFAHMVNNGVTLILLYANNKKYLDFDVESQEHMPYPIISISVLISGVILSYFYKNRIIKP